ncbi:MAG: glycyl-radical enzyme activating protein [Chloroflexi bacterium]|nr:glycyl-radical enzyme activating protein [Chloroflexota bacterium]
MLLDSRESAGSGEKGSAGNKGVVFNIQRYSIHDGPGIRSTVFFKPASPFVILVRLSSTFAELMVRETRCNGCGRCIKVCAPGALSLAASGLRLDRVKCDLCLKCIEACWEDVLELAGRQMTVDEVIEECSKDDLFYRNSGGGVTLSGGEPLLQADFALQLLRNLKDRGFNTALDTCGQVPWETLEKALAYTDLVLFDVKHIDSEEHRDGTGTDNKLILSNLEKLMAANMARIWIRVPVIPGYNDSDRYMQELAGRLQGMKAEKVSLLGYHEWGRAKYQSLGRAYQLSGRMPLSEERLSGIIGIFKAKGLDATAGY